MLPKVFFFFFFWGGGGGGGGGEEERLVLFQQIPHKFQEGGGGGGEMGKILGKYSNGQMLPFASSPSHSIHKFQGFCQSGAPT